MPELTIQIVGWNSSKYLGPAAQALAGIPSDQVAIRYIDNASSDDSVEIIKSILPRADIIQLNNNEGFAGAHNIALKQCQTDFVMTHDPDLQIEWPALEKLLAAFQDPTVAAVQGRLMRTNEEGIIDSAGIELTLTLNGRERGAGQSNKGQYDSKEEVAAVSGACGIYRMSALRQIAHRTNSNQLEIFDNDFFAYKEDVDLGWRLKRAGWKILYLPILQGRHNRTLGKRGILPWVFKPFGLYKRLATVRTRYSLRNYVWMVTKNISWQQEIVHDFFIFLRLAYFFGLSIVYPPLLSVWPEILRGIPNMLRKKVQANQTIT